MVVRSFCDGRSTRGAARRAGRPAPAAWDRGQVSRPTVLGLARCLALMLLAAVPAGAVPAIEVWPRAPRVGEVVFVTLRPDRPLLRASCSWAGRSYSFLTEGEAWSLVLPVSLKTRAGDHHATIYWKYGDGGGSSARVQVEVKPRRFGVQRLRLTASQQRCYTAPEAEREYQLIGTALDRVTLERRWRGAFLMPVQGRLSTSYGLQRYVNGKLSSRHRGVDIAAPEGTPVRAAAAGEVSLANPSFLLHGQTVVIDHGHGVSTLYLHLSEIAVAPGQAVEQGQVIGKVGATGVATGPHLHYAIYAYHEAVDPHFWTRLPR